MRHLSLSEHEMKMEEVISVVFLVTLGSHVPFSVSCSLECNSAVNILLFHIIWHLNTYHLLCLVLNQRKQPKTLRGRNSWLGCNFLKQIVCL